MTRSLIGASRALFLGLVLSTVGAFGCSAAEDLDQETDCNDICTRHSDCFDRDYDVSGCQKRCVDRANADEGVAEDVEACDSCLDRTSCEESKLECVDTCSSVIP